MIEPFLLRPLTRRHIEQAYALVRQQMPQVTEARWRAFARARIGAAGPRRDCGIMTLQSQAGYILGLFVYSAWDDIEHGRTLGVAHIAVAELVGQASLARHLIDGMVVVARLNDCAAIDARLPRAGLGEIMHRQFRHTGFEVDGRHAQHRLAGDAPLAARVGAG
jgi:hypothetical protein